MRSWLGDCIDKLNLQVNLFEAEVETLHAASKKKKVDKDVSQCVRTCGDVVLEETCLEVYCMHTCLCWSTSVPVSVQSV